LHVHEKNELTGHITVEQLRKLAAALDCELVYALVSRRDLEDVITRRADAIARVEVQGVSHTMALENQKPGSMFEEDQIAERKIELIKGKWTKLWR
jgi:predicted DNA-binding mobile mystery protein A